MTTARFPTRQPFTVVLCTQCTNDSQSGLVPMLRAAVRACPHGMLVTTGCLLGQLNCAARPGLGGVMLVLQPCTRARTPVGPAQWVGPIDDAADVDSVCDWIGQGNWDDAALPDHLRAGANLAAQRVRN